METYNRQAAYLAVMARIQQTVDFLPQGTQEPGPRGPQAWLAEQLGLPRQSIYSWEKTGIPHLHAEKIAELLDWDPIQVCPSLLGEHYLPTEVFGVVAKSKKPFHVRVLELMQIGLKRERAQVTAITEKPVTKRYQPEQPMKAVGGFIPISAEELANQREEAIKAGADLSIRGRRK